MEQTNGKRHGIGQKAKTNASVRTVHRKVKVQRVGGRSSFCGYREASTEVQRGLLYQVSTYRLQHYFRLTAHPAGGAVYQ